MYFNDPKLSGIEHNIKLKLRFDLLQFLFLNNIECNLI